MMVPQSDLDSVKTRSEKSIEILKHLDGFGYSDADKILNLAKDMLYANRHKSIPKVVNLDIDYLQNESNKIMDRIISAYRL